MSAQADPGGAFRAGRVARGLSLGAAAALLDARPQDLRALEWGRPDLLDADVAARLVEAYAELLQTGRAPVPAPAAREPGLVRALLEPVALGAVIVGVAAAGVTAAEVISSGRPEATLGPPVQPPGTTTRGRAVPATTAGPATAPGGATTAAPPSTRPRPSTAPPTVSIPPPASGPGTATDPDPTRPPGGETAPRTTTSETPPANPTSPAATAVRLVGIVASPLEGTIKLQWYASGAVARTHVFRTIAGGAEQRVWRGRRFAFVDKNVRPGAVHRYRVVAFDANGARSNVLEVTVRAAGEPQG